MQTGRCALRRDIANSVRPPDKWMQAFLAGNRAKLWQHLQVWLLESFRLLCATTAQSNRRTTRKYRSGFADYASRGWRTEDRRGHKAGSSFRFGVFDCPRRRSQISECLKDCRQIESSHQIRGSNRHRCQWHWISGTVRTVTGRHRRSVRNHT